MYPQLGNVILSDSVSHYVLTSVRLIALNNLSGLWYAVSASDYIKFHHFGQLSLIDHVSLVNTKS